MDRFDIVIIGAGPAGCMSALAAYGTPVRGRRPDICLIEASGMIGRKIYSTGNGRCNLANRRLTPQSYMVDGTAPDNRFMALFSERNADWLLETLRSRGFHTHDRDGLVYPVSDQASALAAFFERELARTGIRVMTGVRVTGFALSQVPERTGRFTVRTGAGEYGAKRLVICCGGMAAPGLGGTDDGIKMMAGAGHGIHDPYPALVPLLCDDPRLKTVKGVRCSACIVLYDGINGLPVCSDTGELQLLQDSLSGIPVFQLSAAAGLLLKNGRKPYIIVDFLPGRDNGFLNDEFELRRRMPDDLTLGAVLLGLVNDKVLRMILADEGLQPEMKKRRITDDTLMNILNRMKAVRFEIFGSAGFEKAQLMAGGVPMKELNEDMSSRIVPGLYAAGELCDVNGLCGGYNLQWAMISGAVAGESAARSLAGDI